MRPRAALLPQSSLFMRLRPRSRDAVESFAMPNVPASSASRKSHRLDETTRTIITAVLVALFIRMFAFEPFNIPSSSMVPGLLIGDFLFVSKYSYGYSSRSTVMGLLPIKGRLFDKAPERGDVVVFKLPSDNSTDYIKRLVGLPGDTIEMRNGLLYINGVAVQRRKLETPIVMNYVQPSSTTTDYIETFPDGHEHIIREEGDDRGLDDTPVFTVPPRSYFFMGDNRDNSQDSRTSRVGFVPEENLVGKARILFFSLDDRARFWEIWKWPWALRLDRLFKAID